ncbi:thiamine diphosphokinase [Aliishimia ponticola]|uniref:Thiamine diphosphokinase n=1 Tax=Aliishimia ponticola TaxID=2499833 RepID=A0A4S4NB96_9RHOB|nr:thiamine diphosphokinase [Aliishimia ponticola]THH35737.1 thiamine diphosphokinase [Aliishimia ponticola]
MIDPVILSKEPTTLVGGGMVGAQDIALAFGLAPRIVAADGGAAAALQYGHVPDAVIGDFDSLDSQTKAMIPPDNLHPVSEQDSTDFEKALTRIDAPLIIAVGFSGARIDHQLAVLHGMLRHADRPCILLAEREVILHCPPRFELQMREGAVVSLFPLQPVTGRSAGLHWPIDGLAMAPGQQIGTSNRATGGLLRLEMDGPGMIALLPRAQLAQVTRALLNCAPEHARWPAPGR